MNRMIVTMAPVADEGTLLHDQLTMPISSANPPADTALFEQPADSSRKLYLPRYRLGQRVGTGGPQYRMHFKKEGGTTTLTLHLEQFPAPEVAEQAAAQEAQELPHNVRVRLVFKVPMGRGGQAQIERSFQEVAAETGGVNAVLTLSSLDEMNQIFSALTDASSGARLIVTRTIQVAVLTTRPGDAGELDQLAAQQSQYQSDIADMQPQWQTYANLLDVAGLPVPSPEFIAASIEDLHNHVTEAEQDLLAYSNQMVEVDDGVFIPQIPDPNVILQLESKIARAMITLITAEQNLLDQVTRRMDEINNPRYAVLNLDLELVIAPDPFIFPKETSAYIYGDITGGDSLGLEPFQVKWQDTFHHYYQNQAQPNVFYYLPDKFKQARRGESPHVPNMRLQFNIVGGSTQGVQALLNYQAVPWTDPDRLAAAAIELSKHTDGANNVEFLPLAVGSDRLTFRLALPPSGTLQDMAGSAQVDFEQGITGTLSMSLVDFQNAFSAMLGGSLTLLNGQVHVNLDDAESDDVPLTLRMDDLAGDIFDCLSAPDPVSAGMQVILRNAIESPLQVNRLSARLGAIQGTQPDLPVTLQPGDSLICRVIPSGPLPGDGALLALFDFSGVKVLADRDKIWAAMLDPNTPAAYDQTITVQAFPQTFADAQVNAISIQFEHGDTVQVDASTLKASATVRLPISDFVLNLPDQGQYRYKQTVVRNGIPTTDSQWRTGSATILFPNPNL